MSRLVVAAVARAPALKEKPMLRTAPRPLVSLVLAAAVAAGCATPATAGHPGASTRSLEQRAARVLESHRARREFPGAVLALRDPSGAPVTVTAGSADAARGGVPVDP